MSDDEDVTLYTLPEQFVEFAKFLSDKDRDGSTINLYRSDYWLRQAKILDDRKLTMTDTGIAWWKYTTKSELTFEEWKEFLNEICDKKGLDLAEVEGLLTNCGLPGTSDVHVPQYRDFLEGYEVTMAEDEGATLEGQFLEFAKFLEPKTRDGTTINLYRSDYWFRQAKILDDRKLTMTDTGHLWMKWMKTEMVWDEWYEYLVELCELKQLDQTFVESNLTNCGLPGTGVVVVPEYHLFFNNFKAKSSMVIK